MDVSIIFVNYKTKDLTIEAINSVLKKTENLCYEIFVVDNASNDGSIETIEEKFGGIDITDHSPQPSPTSNERVPIYIIKSEKNGGFGYANNLAIKQAKGKYILCLNTDTLLINNAIKIMFDFMEREENKNVGVCGGYLTDIEGKPCICGGKFPNLLEIIFKFGIINLFPTFYKRFISSSIKSNEVSIDGDIDQIIGANIFFRKNILDAIGFFDEKFFMYREETDLCKRIKDAGFRCAFVENAKIIHLEGQSTKTKNNLQKKKWFKTSEIYYFKKHHSSQVWLVKLIYTILYLIDWIVNKNEESKDLLKFIIGEG